MRKALTLLLLGAAGLGGFVWGQEESEGEGAQGGDIEGELESLAERMGEVRREIKIIDLDESMGIVPGLAAREREYEALLKQMREDLYKLITPRTDSPAQKIVSPNNVYNRGFFGPAWRWR